MARSEVINDLVSAAIAYGAALLMGAFLHLLTRGADEESGAGEDAPPWLADLE